MLFLWGSKRVSKPIWNIGYSGCEQCRLEQPCSARLDYTIRHFWYVCRWVTGKEYTAFCDVCRNRIGLLDPKIVEAKLKKNPVPFLDRWGWVFALAAFAGLAAWVAVEEKKAGMRDVVYLSAPRVGDIYSIVDDRLAAPGCSDCRYGGALVAAVQPEGVYVRETKTVSNKPFSPRGEHYYMDQREFVSMSQLRDMKARGVITRVDREAP
jgi:hypothetical protein